MAQKTSTLGEQIQWLISHAWVLTGVLLRDEIIAGLGTVMVFLVLGESVSEEA